MFKNQIGARGCKSRAPSRPASGHERKFRDPRRKALPLCRGGSYQILDSESHAGGLLIDAIPGPVTWYTMTYTCGPSDGRLVGRFLHHFGRIERKIDQAVVKLLDLDDKTTPVVPAIDFAKKLRLIKILSIRRSKTQRRTRRVTTFAATSTRPTINERLLHTQILIPLQAEV